MTVGTTGSAGSEHDYPTPAKPPCGLSFAHPLSLRQADAVASDRCRPVRAGRLDWRPQLDGRVGQGGLGQWRGRAFAGDARLDRFENGWSGGRDAAADDDSWLCATISTCVDEIRADQGRSTPPTVD